MKERVLGWVPEPAQPKRKGTPLRKKWWDGRTPRLGEGAFRKLSVIYS